jgi:DNA-binding Lrp family transcriptional regulator
MKMTISPEGLEVANEYLTTGSIRETAKSLCVSEEAVSRALQKAEVKRYIDAVYLDTGYRNRFKLAALLDEVIESKLEEARESEMFTSKDLVDLISLAHKMRTDELKHEKDTITHQTNVQLNEAPFGGGNYGKLMEKLLGNIQEKS